MAAIIPGMESKDVSNFHFRQMTRYQLQNDADQITQFPRTPIQRLALSNKLGIIFAGCKNTLLAVNVSELEKNDELGGNVKASSITPNKMLKTLPTNGSTTIPLPSTPTHISLNADEKTLAVVVTLPSTRKPHIYLFDTRSFSRASTSPKPFQEIPPATPPGVVIMELAWNPVMPSMLAVVFSDGSLALHMINDKGFDSATLPPAEKICCISWSPKGKQLVAGKSDGSLTQYKPDLKEAKNIPKPVDPTNSEQRLSACSILWASTYQFLVLFKNDSNQASLYLVQSSKAGDTKFYNYDDICFSTGELRDPYYMMYHQMDWPLIICASANGIEVALMGNSGAADNASWQQWNLEDAGRAELPLVPNTNEERYPVGMAFCTGGVNRCLPLDDAGNTMPHSVPILFMLAPDGVLCSFYALNKEAAKITKAVEPIEGEVRTGTISLPAAIPSVSKSKSVAEQTLIGGGVKLNLQDKFQEIENANQIKDNFSSNISKPSSEIGFPSFGLQPTLPGKPVIASTPIKTGGFSESFKDKSNSGIESEKYKSEKFQISNQKFAAKDTSIYLSTSAIEKTEVPVGEGKAMPVSQGNNAQSPQSEARYQALIREEILAFEKEMAEFKTRATNISTDVGSNNEKALLKKGLVDMSEFRKLLIETTSSQCREISQLKKQSLENCQWLEEAKSRQSRNKDPRYLQLLKGRSLDPHSQKQLAKVQSKYMYLDQQIDEINNKLDLEWEAHCRKTNLQVTGRGNARRIQNDAAPSLETIYKVLHNHHGIIEKHKSECENLEKSIKALNLNNISSNWQFSKPSSGRKSARVNNDELVKLADSLMEKTLLNENNMNSKSPRPSSSGKACALSPIVGFSPEKESKLKQLLAEKGTTKIVPKQAGVSKSAASPNICPEKASKSLLSSLDKYKNVTMVSVSPKSSISLPNFSSESKVPMTDQKVSIDNVHSRVPLPQTNSIFDNVTNAPAMSRISGFGFGSNTPSVTASGSNKSVEASASTVSNANSLTSKPFSFMGGKPLESSTSMTAPLQQIIRSESPSLFSPQSNPGTSPFSSGSIDISSTSKPFSILPKVTSTITVSSTMPTKVDDTSFQISTTKSAITVSSNIATLAPFSFGSTATPAKNFGISNKNDSQDFVKKDIPKDTSVFAKTSVSTSNVAKFDTSTASISPSSLTSVQVTPISTLSDTDSKYISSLNKLANVIPDESPKTQITSSGLFSGAQVTSQTLQDKLGSKNDASKENTSLFKNELQTAPKSSNGIFGNSTSVTSTSSSIFPINEKSSTPIFGAPTTTTTSTSVFGGNSTTSKNLFGNSTIVPATSSSGIFGTDSPKSATIFGGPAIASDKTPQQTSETTISSSNTTIFGSGSSISSKTVTSTTSSTEIFGQAANTKTTTAAAGIFGGSSSTITTTASIGIFGGGSATQTTPASTGIFGGGSAAKTTPASTGIFGGSSVTQSTSASTGIFGGSSATKTTTESTGIFGGSSFQASSLSSPTKTTVAASNSIFGASSFNSTPSTATATSAPTSSTSIFGGSSFKGSENATTTTTSSSVFGGNADMKANTTSGGGSIFGGSGGFFSGLGSNPSSDAASKNVFGGSSGSGGSIFGGGSSGNSLFGSTTTQSSSNATSIFGGGNTASPFGGTKTASGFGSFTSAGGNVSSQGFGIGQPESTPAKTGTHSFGTAPTFGSSPTGNASTAAPAFGGGPTFGSSPAFGGASSFGSAPVFGGSSTSAFGTMGTTSTNAPTFASIGQNTGGSTFGTLSSNTPTFGSANAQSGFGGFSSPNNSQPNTNVFGSSGGATSPGGASFNSWR